MGEQTYKATAFIGQDSDFSIVAAFDVLRRVFTDKVQQSESGITIEFGNWRVQVNEYAGTGDFEKTSLTPHDFDISRCERRAVVTSDDPNPGLDHFNDFLVIAEHITDSFTEVYTRDDNSGRWY